MRNLLWIALLLAALAVIAVAIYRSRSESRLNVTPDAERAIEKAKRR